MAEAAVAVKTDAGKRMAAWNAVHAACVKKYPSRSAKAINVMTKAILRAQGR